MLTEADAARKAHGEAARREAKEQEKAKAERLRQERREQSHRRREVKPQVRRGETEEGDGPHGVIARIAALPSEISWRVPIGAAVVLLLGWMLPGKMFMLNGLG